MSSRNRLPNRHASETFDFICDGTVYSCSYSRFDDGSLAELFLSSRMAGSHADIAAKDAAIMASIALQCGENAGDLARRLTRNSSGRPIGPLAVALDQIVGLRVIA